MNIKIISHKTLVNAINARDLHSELEVETRFNDWIIRKIEQYHFIENEDFVSFTQKRVKPQGGRPPRDYFVSIDMAKEIAMTEETEKGSLARRYFIQCEKELYKLRERKLAEIQHIEAMRKLLLLDSPGEWVKRFPDEFYIAIMKLHHQDFDGNKSTPLYCANITRRWIYNVIIPKEIMAIIDENKRGEKVHQWLTTDAGQQMLSQQIGKVIMIAKMCASRNEFELKCGVLFLGTPLQLTIQ